MPKMALLPLSKNWSCPRLNDAQFPAHALEDVQRLRQFLAGVDGRHDGAHAALIDGNSGIDDALREDAFREESPAELHGKRAFAHDHRRDGRLAVASIEAKLFQAAFEEGGVLPQTLDEAI